MKERIPNWEEFTTIYEGVIKKPDSPLKYPAVVDKILKTSNLKEWWNKIKNAGKKKYNIDISWDDMDAWTAAYDTDDLVSWYFDESPEACAKDIGETIHNIDFNRKPKNVPKLPKEAAIISWDDNNPMPKVIMDKSYPDKHFQTALEKDFPKVEVKSYDWIKSEYDGITIKDPMYEIYMFNPNRFVDNHSEVFAYLKDNLPGFLGFVYIYGQDGKYFQESYTIKDKFKKIEIQVK